MIYLTIIETAIFAFFAGLAVWSFRQGEALGYLMAATFGLIAVHSAYQFIAWRY